MTRTPDLGAPYYVISFDATTGSTRTVTDGSGTAVRTVFLHRRAALAPGLPARLERVVAAARELETIVGHDALDVEFAFTEGELPHILQVRPITARPGAPEIGDGAVAASIDRAAARLRARSRPSAILVGRSTQLSVMADWNPAEMIGTRPRRLALSLYRRLLTDEAWAQQRAEAGYRDVRPSPLLVEVLGHPYVDVRLSFNSFVPADLPDALAARLVDHYLERLARRPELHDKVEFDVLLTCLCFDFDRKARGLREAGFAPDEVERLRGALREITRDGIRRCASDVEAVTRAEARRLDSGETSSPLARAARLLDDARRDGAPRFAHLARQGFVATALLASLRSRGCLDDEEVESFRSSVHTVSRRMQEHAAEVARGERRWSDFVEAYGHLRPGTYDITSACYAAAPELYLRPVVEAARAGVPAATPFRPSARSRRAIETVVREADLGVDGDGLLRFMARAIEGRELGKFVLTRHVSAALEAIAEFGAPHGVSRDALAHVGVDALLALEDSPDADVRRRLALASQRGRQAFRLAQSVCLPAHVRSEADLRCFEQTAVEPNYVTRKTVRGDVVALRSAAQPDLRGAIVLIPNADPGYDWLFAHGIRALVTAYGGLNSHMAVRAAEFGLPAAIGVGELLFDVVRRARMVELDCASRQIRVLD